MNLTTLIILCLAITLALIIFPLIVSYKAEKSKKQDEWDKIATYGKKINKKTHKNKLHKKI
jgi:hypothetical protein